MLAGRAYRCQCGKPVFFPNSQCLACGTALGYEPERARLWPLKPHPGMPGAWLAWGEPDQGVALRRCANFAMPAACNWLIRADDPFAHLRLCRACRLNRTIPALDDPQQLDNGQLWGAMEQAKRRLVSVLIALRLPVRLPSPPGRRGREHRARPGLDHTQPGGSR